MFVYNCLQEPILCLQTKVLVITCMKYNVSVMLPKGGKHNITRKNVGTIKILKFSHHFDRNIVSV